MGGGETNEFEVPPELETPPVYERVQPHYFGVTPRGLVAGVAAVALVAAIVALATGNLAVGLLLLVAALFLVALFVEQARRSRTSSLDRVAAAAVDHTRALAGFTGASVRAWTRAGREVTKLRLEASRLARERSQLQYALGGAAFDENDARIAELRAQMRERTDRIEACAVEARATVQRARTRTKRERLAVASTEIRKPG